MSAPAVEALNLSKRYGRVDALSDASFFAPGSAITVLLGENGAGKTTAVKLILGFLRPDTGGSSPGLPASVSYRTGLYSFPGFAAVRSSRRPCGLSASIPRTSTFGRRA